jgi:hypothetical protein
VNPSVIEVTIGKARITQLIIYDGLSMYPLWDLRSDIIGRHEFTKSAFFSVITAETLDASIILNPRLVPAGSMVNLIYG